MGSSAQFHLWGPVRTNVKALQDRSNVTLHGTIPYSDLAAAYARIDVLVIPFRMGDLGSTINPIKLYEGLATGRPVLVPELPNLRALGAPLYFYSDTEQLVRLLRDFGQRQVIEIDERGVAFGRDNSWASRAATVLQFFEASR
jgi:glycosyltransferase involved in cell wall biosynthesis